MWNRIFGRNERPSVIIKPPWTDPAPEPPTTAEEYRETILSGIVARDPRRDEALARISASVEMIPDPDSREHQRTHVPRWLQTVAMFPEGKGDLVDVAAAPFYADALRYKGWNVVPVATLSIDYEKDRLPYPDERFDAALLAEVIEHFVIDPLFALNEINRILKVGGTLVITTPNIASWFAIYQALNQRHPARWPVYARDPAKARNHLHAREYTVTELRLIVEAAGFEIIEIVTLDYGIAPPHAPIAGFDTENRGETIFLSARKTGKPRLRAVAPIYLESEPFTGYEA